MIPAIAAQLPVIQVALAGTLIAAAIWACAGPLRRAIRNVLRGLAFSTVCMAAFVLGAGYAVRGAWRFLRKAERTHARKPPEPRKAFDSAGIPVADWDRFCGEISAIQRDMVRAASRWRQP